MLTTADKRVIVAYAKNDMNCNRAGDELHYNHTSIHYHLNRIREKTGLDPRKFYDLIKLLEEVNAK